MASVKSSLSCRARAIVRAHLRDLKRMRQPRAVMIPLRRNKDLRLALEPAKGFAVQDPVPVPLKLGAHVVRRDRPLPAPGLAAELGIGAECLPFPVFQSLFDGHGTHSFRLLWAAWPNAFYADERKYSTSNVKNLSAWQISRNNSAL